MERNLRFKIDRADLIVRRILPVLLCFTLYLRAISNYKPLGAYIWRGLCMEGLIFGILRYVVGIKAKLGNRNLMSRIAAMCPLWETSLPKTHPPPAPSHWRAEFCPMTTPKLASNHWTYVCWETSHQVELQVVGAPCWLRTLPPCSLAGSEEQMNFSQWCLKLLQKALFMLCCCCC